MTNFTKICFNYLLSSARVAAIAVAVLFIMAVQSSTAATYYLTTAGAGAAETAGNWNTGGSGGGGTAALNFTTAGDVFIIDNATIATFGASATFGSSANAVTLLVDGSVTVNNTFTLTIGVSPANSIVVFSNTGATQCSGAGGFTLASGSTLKTQNANGVKGTNCSIANGMAGALNAAANYEFNGTGSQVTLGLPATVSNLIVNNGANSVTLSANVAVSGILTIASGSTLDFGTTARTLNLSGTGANTLNNSGTIDMSGGNEAHELWIYATSIANFGTLINGTTATASTVRYLGTNYIINATPVYNILRIDGGGTATASSNITIAANGKLWIYGATFDLGTNTANCLTGGSATFLIQGNLIVGGANNFPANYTTYTFNGNRTITYNMNGNQTIFTMAGFAYDCWLVLSGSGIKQVTGQPLAYTSGLGYSTTINAGVTLDLNGLDGNTISTLTGAGTIDNLNSSATGSYTLNIKTPGAHGTFSGLIKNTYGTLAINKQGIYTETLSGLNTYTGGTTVSNGIIALGISSSSAANGPLGAASGGINVLPGASLFMNGFSLTGAAGQALTLSGNGYSGAGGYGALSNYTGSGIPTYSGLITLTGNTQIFGDINITNAGTITGSGFNLTLRSQGSFGSNIASNIGTGSGTVSLVSDAGQIWTLSGANTYSGATTISAGTLKIGAAGVGANTPLGTSAGATTVGKGASLDLNGYSLTAAESLTINGTGISNGGALTNSSSAAVTFPGLITLGSTGASIIANAGDINIANSGTITGSGFGLILGGSGNGTMSSSIGTGAGTLTKTGSGTWTLSAANTFTGGTSLTGGILNTGASNVLSSAGAVTFNGGTFSSGTTAGYSQTVGLLNISSNGTLALGTGVHSINFSAAGTFLYAKTLTITGWQGAYNGTSGTAGKVFVGSSAGLTSVQLTQIKFFDGSRYYASTQLSTGEVVPIGAFDCPVYGLINGGFEAPAVAAGGNGFFYDTLVPGWRTTSPDHMMEIWSSGFLGVPSYSGKQFCEINAYQAGALYQDIATTPGDSLYWKCAHRGRSGVDTMTVSIGPPSLPVLQKVCADGNTAWGTYSGIYVVPAGQGVTRFSFLAKYAAGGASFGNFIDDVGFRRYQDTTVCQATGYKLHDGTVVFAPGVYPDMVARDSGCLEDIFIRVSLSQDPKYCDTAAVILPPVSNFSASDSVLCTNDCINFTNLSTNATSWKWSFPGGTPSSATDQNPNNVCYLSNGIFNVTLIASNSAGSDTVTFSQYINVITAPSTPVITQSHDTLFCSIDTSYTSYQWYDDTGIIAGETKPFLVIAGSGNYNVQVSNENGCKIAVGINIVLGVHNYMTDNSVSVYPNPAHEVLMVSGNYINANIFIFNVLGEIMLEEKTDMKGFTRININKLSKGVYFVQLKTVGGNFVKRFVKE